MAGLTISAAGIASRSFAPILAVIWAMARAKRSAHAAVEGKTPDPPAHGATYTCPMHPEIIRDGPGSCPICGMALEPMTVSADEDVDPELDDMSRRFWICLALTTPLLAPVHGRDGSGLVITRRPYGPAPGVDSIRPGGPRGLVGRHAVLRAGMGLGRSAVI